MLSKRIEELLNKQIEQEAESSQYYLAMASYAETKGYNGVADFMYRHSDEERAHMMKLVRFVNERGGHAIVPALSQPPKEFAGITEMFQNLLDHEVAITNKINELVAVTLEERDYTTHNFLQWYVSEQIEEEALARTVMDKLNLIGNDKGGLYMFDRDIAGFSVTSANDEPGA
jgi:ferritin